MHRIVGLDLSSDAVRLVALESGFRGFRVVQMAQADLGAEGTLADRLRPALAQLAHGQPFGGDAVAVSLPGSQVASFPMTLPFTDARRIEQVLPAEIEGAIPFDLDEVVWDYSVLSQDATKSELIVAVVRKLALREAIDAFVAAGVDPRVVTFAPMALASLGEKKLLVAASPFDRRTEPSADLMKMGREQPGPEVQHTEAILEAGPDRADFCVLKGGHASLARSLPTSGRAAWEAAAHDLGALDKLLASLVRDLKLTLRALAGRRGTAPERVLIAGRLAALDGVCERLTADLGLPCEPLELTAEARPPGVNDPSPHALALGLALRAQQPRGRLNFRKDEFAFTKDVSQQRGQFFRLSLAVAAVLALALVTGIARLNALGRQGQAYDDALCRATELILKRCYTDYREALGALRGGNSKASAIPRVSATEILAEVTNALPDGSLPDVEDIEVTTTRVTVKGTVDGFDKIAPMTDALKKDRCFGDIRPARTENVANSKKKSFVLDFAYVCSGETAGGA